MKKIGFLDSGLGGLSLLKNFFNSQLSGEIFYISDEANVPYGEKSQQFMLAQVSRMVEALEAKGVDLIVIACNTLTAETIDCLRKNFATPFVGIEPYLNIINHHQSLKSYGLILTEATYKSERFKSLKERFDPKDEVKVFPLKKLALLIEKLKYVSFEQVKDEINLELDRVGDVNVLILGCTHYPLISTYIESYLKVKTIIPDGAIVQRIQEVLRLEKSSSSRSDFSYSSDLGQSWETVTIDEFNFLANV